ncbi:ribosome recycling factor [Candidatus Kaiserbacteria bacterium CG10_big_fil_rev_8_21_14_0_10_59_10]|uniref:Ribosome recycling factor n=1 Tax=Candidatus Kaiserbacteria bacterium CG10_big_fil_rev_8_21_14_0_10_59_10 TaxID=1974612 RepID=A0A2H0U8U7_9BACT|nr:MAG: ribosome recycling factor [Candidatus Kaiserbacteria bacterium CG10_big_fil_rev_8_21_14_0_10_59_10]
MANYDFKELDQKFAGAKEWLSREYKTLRTGRANPSILDSVQVSAYGSMQPIQHVASVSVEGPRSLYIQPYDTSLLKDIERAVAAANLGLGTGADQSGVRVTFPELTAERRAEFVKIAKAKLEEARAAVRVARDEVWKDVQEKEREGELTEDDKYQLKDELQKKVDSINAELEAAFEAKEKEMQS